LKILFVTPRLPYPPYKGDKLRTWHFIRELSKEHTVDLLSFVESDEERQYTCELKKHCRNVKTVLLPKWWSVFKMLSGLLSLVPFQVLYYSSLRMHFHLKRLLAREKYDVVHVVLVRMLEYAAECRDVPVVIDHIDALSLNIQRRMDNTRNPLKRLAFWWESKKLKIYEKKCERLQTFGVITSPVDANALNHHWSAVISNGVSTEDFRPENVEKKFDAIFTGNMSYFPNVDAVQHYQKNVLPLVCERREDHQCYIVGIEPSKDVQAAHDGKNMVVTGFVEDLVGYLNRACLFVAPLQAGTGIQNKVLEAMSCGLPVVSTSYGNAGIQARHGCEVLIADDPQRFCDAVIELLNNPQYAKRLGKSARELVKRRFSWTAAAQRLAASYRQAIHLNRMKVIEHRTGRISIEALQNEECAVLHSRAIYRGLESRLERCFNAVVAGIGLVLASPLMATTALAIRLTSKGPIIFRQLRVGQGGRTFGLLKFRTMVHDAEKQTGAVFAGQNDTRVTPLGRFLRKTRLDELPQFINVLRGDMRLVGPRPERPEFVNGFNRQLPLYRQRHYVKPGLTGWAQVKFPYAANINDTYKKLQYDLYYVKNKSLLLDFGILLRTVGVVLTGKGAR